jgi:hypothetical protein
LPGDPGMRELADGEEAGSLFAKQHVNCLHHLRRRGECRAAADHDLGGNRACAASG